MSILTPIFGFIKSQTGDNIGKTIGEDLPANWDKAEQLINDLDALVGLGGVAESGTNDNGSYVKFEDGTMICQISIAESIDITTTMGVLYKSEVITWTYPAVFFSPAVLSISSTPLSSNTLTMSGLVAANLLTSMTFRLISTSSSNATIRYNIIAIGRWK